MLIPKCVLVERCNAKEEQDAADGAEDNGECVTHIAIIVKAAYDSLFDGMLLVDGWIEEGQLRLHLFGTECYTFGVGT